MLLEQIVFLAINLQIVSGHLYPSAQINNPNQFRFKEVLAQILTGVSNPFDTYRTTTFLNKLRNSPLPILDAYDDIWIWRLDKRINSRMKESFRRQCMRIGNPINKSTDFDANENVTIFSNFMFQAYIEPHKSPRRGFNYYINLLESRRAIYLEPKIADLNLNKDEKKKYLCSGFKVLEREFKIFKNMPYKDTFFLEYSTTIKSMLRNLFKSDRNMNKFGISKMTYKESKEFFKLVRFIQECDRTIDCWPFFKPSTELTNRLIIGIIEARFKGIGKRSLSKLHALFIENRSSKNLTKPGSYSIQPFHYKHFSDKFDYSQFYNETQFNNCSTIPGLKNQVKCLSLL